MTIEFKKDGASLYIKPVGRLDTPGARELDERLPPELAGVSSVLLDMAEVEYISSGGLRVLLTTEQEMQDRGGKLKVTHVGPQIMEIFEMTGFTDILDIE